MKKLLILLLLLPNIAHAATFESVDKFMDTWRYTFEIKTSSIAVETPLAITELDCNTPKNHRTGEGLLQKPTKCFDTEEGARADAQSVADKFEKDKITNGESSTMIEAKRLYYKGKSKITQ